MLKILRCLIAAALAVAAVQLATTPAQAVPCTTTNPHLTGSFIQPDLVDSRQSSAQVATQDSHLASACVTDQILQWTADSKNKTTVYPSSLSGYTQSTTNDVVDATLSNAESTGTRVWVGLQVNDDWWTKYADDTTWLTTQADTAKAIAADIWSNYGAYGSLTGWYLPFEVDNDHFQTTTEQDNLAAFYSDVIGYLHTLSGLPVAISPFYNANLSGSLSTTGWQSMWTRILSAAPVDVIAVQDGVGAGHATSTQLAGWFSATKSAITASGSSAALYDDAETYIFGASGLQPMPVKDVVTDMSAVSSYVTGNWSFSFDHYLSSLGMYSPYYEPTYTNYLSNGSVETSAPGTPASLSATATNSQTVSLSWTAPTDNIGVAGYYIYRGGDLVAQKNGSASGFTDTQLAGSTSYSYTVKAFDGAGNLSPSSPTASVTTPSAPTYSTNLAAGKSYTSSTPADAAYPDTGNTELTDGVLATSPTYGAVWQGRNNVGTYSFVIDLGASQTVHSITSDWLQVRGDYVFLPNSVKYEVSANGTTYTTAGTISLPAVNSTNQIKTYQLISLSATGRYVRVTVDGGSAWSMLDEVKVLS